MNFNVRTIPSFEKEAKKLSKKYPSIRSDLKTLIESLEKKPIQGTPIGNDFYKVRLAVASKQKGKSGGARVITCVKIIGTVVFLASIYDKSEQSTISDAQLKFLAKQIALF